MVIECEGGSAETAEYVEVGGFGGERKRSGGKRCFAIQAGAAEVRTEEEMGDGFQGMSLDEGSSSR